MTLSVKAKSTGARAQQTRLGRAPRGRSARASLAPTSPGTQRGTPAPPPPSPTSGPPGLPLTPPAAPGSPPAPGLPRSPPLTLAPPGLRPFGNRGRVSAPLARPVRRHLGGKLAPPASAAHPSAARRPPPAAHPGRGEAPARSSPRSSLHTEPAAPPAPFFQTAHTCPRLRAVAADGRGAGPGSRVGPGGGARGRIEAEGAGRGVAKDLCGVGGVSKWTKLPGGNVRGSRCRPRAYLGTRRTWRPRITWAPAPPGDPTHPQIRLRPGLRAPQVLREGSSRGVAVLSRHGQVTQRQRVLLCPHPQFLGNEIWGLALRLIS